MGRKRTPGLYCRNDVWHIDKKVHGRRLCESTGTSSLEAAEVYLAKQIEQVRQSLLYGVRKKRTFREAFTRYLDESVHKASYQSDAGRIVSLDPYIGHLHIDTVNIGTLQTYIKARRDKGLKTRTINHGLKVVRRILNLAATEWVDEHGLTWLLTAPKIKLLPEPDLRKPCPLNWEEQERLFNLLPEHLKSMALFAVNTGCRDSEICSLRWDWEAKAPQIPGGSVFLIPGENVKNGEDRLVILNRAARSVIEKMRDQHSDYVFTYRGKQLSRMLNTAWKNARAKAELDVRVHDLKHTYGRRLRAAGVSFEDRQDLLGHKSGRITTHYSAAELVNLYEAANKVCEQLHSSPTLSVIRGSRNAVSRKSPARGFEGIRQVNVSA